MNHRTITFKALPFPLPAEYREQLKQLGFAAVTYGRRAEERTPRNPADVETYEEASRLLELYEKNLRRSMGVEITRPTFEPIGVWK